MSIPLPRCPQPFCPGHLGKFSDCLTEALWEISLDGGENSTGDTDWQGHYTLIILETDDTVTIDPDGAPRVVVVPAGSYILQTMTSGAVVYDSYSYPQAARMAFEDIDMAYGKWLDQD